MSVVQSPPNNTVIPDMNSKGPKNPYLKLGVPEDEHM